MGIRWENTALGSEFARNLWADIGPLQLGVVLVSISFTFVSLIYLKVKKAVSNGLDLQRYILKSCTVGGQADRHAETQTSN